MLGAMKQIWIRRAGGPEVLELREAPDPVPAPGEVLVDVKASGVNFADVMARAGKYGDAPPLPCVVGYEVAGEVIAVGEARDSGPGRQAAGTAPVFSVGDRVFGLTRFGGYSSRVSVAAEQLFPMGSDMSYEQAAAIPVNYFTAYLALCMFGNVQAGERVLIHNAGGGVGVAAVQLALRAGATVYGTASGWKHARLRELGVHELVDYTTTDWVEVFNGLTGGPGMHVILDSIGGRNVKRDLSVMAPLSRLSAFGFSEPARHGDRPLLPTLRSLLGMPRPHLLSLLSNNWSIGGLNLGHLWTELGRLRRVGEDVLRAWEEGAIRPEIAATYPFEEAAEAHRMLGERRNLGKVVLVP
jgi:NADPH:quinone reductase-like Zn-dependent oxidoreductase